jgi:hypothetical protein
MDVHHQGLRGESAASKGRGIVPRPFLFFLPLFTEVRGETVWKIGISPEMGFRRR